MRLKLRFSFTGYNAIKLFKHLMIQEGYPNTVTSGYAKLLMIIAVLIKYNDINEYIIK